MSRPVSENFLNKYKNLNLNSNSWGKYNNSGGLITTSTSSIPNYYDSGISTSSYRFERDPILAQEVLSRAGASSVYSRPGYAHEVSNVAKLTTEITHQPASYTTVQYKINEDNDPIRIVRPIEPVTQRQNVRVRYLEPPNPPTPAPIVIKERQLTPPPPAPPILVRQIAQAPPTPPPLFIRERPPAPPDVATETTFIEKIIPPPTPPPRQVIVERIPAPEKPRDIVYEKWLPYKPVADRQVILERGKIYEKQPAPKNIIIEYEKPNVNVERLVYDEGVLRNVDPSSYYTSRVDGELRLVDKINDLPLANQSYTRYIPSPQPTRQIETTRITELRPKSAAKSIIARGPVSYYGPFNTTYRTSYTGRGFAGFKNQN